MDRIQSVLHRIGSAGSIHGKGLKGSSSSGPHKTHTQALSQHPQYPARGKVTQVSWMEADPGYSPVDFTHKIVMDNAKDVDPKGWADPTRLTQELCEQLKNRASNALEIGGKVNMVDGKPRNPIGRTGMTGRGLLGKFGPNYAADPLVTRIDPETNKLQMVAIMRKDTGDWAIPGGMVDEGEKVSVAARREFMEECRHMPEGEKQEVEGKLEKLFASGGVLAYAGYVDDPRNTDMAWMETTCYHFHIADDFLATHLKLSAGDDAAHSKWLDITDADPEFKNLYASHRSMVIMALKHNPVRWADALKLVHHE